MIAIIDYGVGNLFSLQSSFAAIGQEAVDITVYTKKMEKPEFTETGVYVFVCPSYMSAPARAMTDFPSVFGRVAAESDAHLLFLHAD